MRLKLRKRTTQREAKRAKNKLRIRKKVTGTGDCPRLCVFRSAKHIYAQIIDDSSGQTLVSASTLGNKLKETGVEGAKAVGQLVAAKALDQKIESVVFDRNGYIYHGRIEAVASGAREAGLKF